VLRAIEPAARNLRHVQLMQDYKVYGAHLGPFKTPAREDGPAAHATGVQCRAAGVSRGGAAGQGMGTWSALRPSVVCGFALGIPMNLAMVIAVYATICQHLGVPLRFPGKPGAYRSLIEMTDAGLLARAMVWAAASPRAANQAYNINNGDMFRWEEMWPKIAGYFGVPAAPRPADEPRHRDGQQTASRQVGMTASPWAARTRLFAMAASRRSRYSVAIAHSDHCPRPFPGFLSVADLLNPDVSCARVRGLACAGGSGGPGR
jgi:nucleoside-diphosphate-sugar epimerase